MGLDEPSELRARLLKETAEKTAPGDLALRALEQPQRIPAMVGIMASAKGTAKFACAKALLLLSESRPEAVYPYFDDIARLLGSDNNIIKWDAAITLANLAPADRENKFEKAYGTYFSLLDSDSMITAGNAVKNAWKIVMKYPTREEDITARILRAAGRGFLYKGEPSPECGYIFAAGALECFDRYFDLSGSKEKMLDFARALADCPRASTAKKARGFLTTYG